MRCPRAAFSGAVLSRQADWSGLELLAAVLARLGRAGDWVSGAVLVVSEVVRLAELHLLDVDVVVASCDGACVHVASGNGEGPQARRGWGPSSSR